MGKSLISYVDGHAICKGYIDSVNIKLDDWIVLNDTLYADNTLKQVLNMTSGDHKYIGEKNFAGGRAGESPASCLLYTSPSPRDKRQSRMPSSA